MPGSLRKRAAMRRPRDGSSSPGRRARCKCHKCRDRGACRSEFAVRACRSEFAVTLSSLTPFVSFHGILIQPNILPPEVKASGPSTIQPHQPRGDAMRWTFPWAGKDLVQVDVRMLTKE